MFEEMDELKKIFVGGLNRSTSDEVFKTYFETFGKVTDAVVIKDRDVGSKLILSSEI